MSNVLDPKVIALAVAFADLLRPTTSTSPDDRLSIDEAALVAKTKKRVLSDARRKGDLEMRGGQRDRSVKRSDLLAWLESRRTKPVSASSAQASRVERRLRNRKP